jgi:hypothetical protein
MTIHAWNRRALKKIIDNPTMPEQIRQMARAAMSQANSPSSVMPRQFVKPTQLIKLTKQEWEYLRINRTNPQVQAIIVAYNRLRDEGLATNTREDWNRLILDWRSEQDA